MKGVVFFDWGGVLGQFNVDLFLERNSRILQTKPVELLSYLNSGSPPSIWEELESIWSKEEIHQKICAHFGADVGLKRFCQEFVYGIEPGDYRRIFPFFQKIRAAGFALGLISNMNEIHRDFVRTVFKTIFAQLRREYTFFSCDIGRRKSESLETFRYILEQCRVDPRDAILIDDSPQNVRGMETVGARGAVFTGSFYELERNLVRMRVLS